MSLIYRLQPEEEVAEEGGKAEEGDKAEQGDKAELGERHQQEGVEGQPLAGALEAEGLRHCNLFHKTRQLLFSVNRGSKDYG